MKLSVRGENNELVFSLIIQKITELLTLMERALDLTQVSSC